MIIYAQYVIIINYLIFNCSTILYVGVGKTHYIKKQFASCATDRMLLITVNECFSAREIIKQLRDQVDNQNNLFIFLNFTLLKPLVNILLAMNH